MKTIIEPFRIKSVEPIRFTTRAERKNILEEAAYNVFRIHSDDVIIDLLTDSGTSAMSSRQWAGVMLGDESYAGSPSFYKFETTVQDITGFPVVIPTHQGRGAEKILFTTMGRDKKIFLSNTLFDTTRANIEFIGGTGIDMPCIESKDPAIPAPFKGNIDVAVLEENLRLHGKNNIALVVLTVTNNSGGGQPVSMENIRQTSALCREYEVPFFIDACRFAENAYFIQQREKGFETQSIREIVRQMFALADGCLMSAKKDAFANIGGFLAMKDQALATQCRNLLVITEGFPTYGGLAGRDLEAIAIGMEEILDQDYLAYRVRSIEYLTEKLSAGGVPVMLPSGGHAVYVDAKAFLPHIQPDQYPGVSLINEIYVHGGIRGVEIGSLMFGKYEEGGRLIPSKHELVRLAIPRRVYTQSHIDYVAEVILEVFKNRHTMNGLKIIEEAPLLRHFTAKLQPHS